MSGFQGHHRIKSTKLKGEKGRHVVSGEKYQMAERKEDSKKKPNIRTPGTFGAQQTTPQPLMTPENFHVVWPETRLVLIMQLWGIQQGKG